jgi:hypothetical protein
MRANGDVHRSNLPLRQKKAGGMRETHTTRFQPHGVINP